MLFEGWIQKGRCDTTQNQVSERPDEERRAFRDQLEDDFHYKVRH